MDQFQGVSYGDRTFSRLILAPLAQKHNVKWRQMAWSEHVHVLRFVTCSENEVWFASSFINFLSPIKKLLVFFFNMSWKDEYSKYVFFYCSWSALWTIIWSQPKRIYSWLKVISKRLIPSTCWRIPYHTTSLHIIITFTILTRQRLFNSKDRQRSLITLIHCKCSKKQIRLER